MTRLGCLALILAVAGGGLADAKTTPHRHRTAARRPALHMPASMTTVGRDGVMHHYSAAAWAQANSRAESAPANFTQTSDNSPPRLGWAWGDDHRQTLVGVYKRPNAPNAYPDLFQKSGGAAAGVAVSMKLGG